MRILDKYIIKKIGSSYLLILAGFIGLYLVAELFTNLDEFIRAKTPPLLVVRYYLYLLPFIFLNSSTFAFAIGVAYTLGELNKNNEIICMRASGLSNARIVGTIIFTSLLLSLGALFLQEKVVIYSQQKAEDIKINFIKHPDQKKKELKNIIFLSDNRLFIASRFSPQENRLQGVKILKEDSQGNIYEQLVCDNLIFDGKQWKASNVAKYTLDKEGKISDKPVTWKKKEIKLDERPRSIILKSTLQRGSLGFHKGSFGIYLPFKMLKKRINTLRKMGSSSSKLLREATVAFHEKLSMPFTHFFLIIGLIPFVLEIKKRRGTILSLVWGVLFGVLYFAIFSISVPLGKEGVIIPELSAWITPLAFLAMGISGMAFIR